MSGVCCGLQRRLLLWRRRGWEVVGDRIWTQLGTYSGCMCAGCAAGVVFITADMRTTILSLDPGPESYRQDYERLASISRFYAFSAVSSIELLCTIFAMNMLLRRVSDHASHR
jgi:hypothetical protein